LIVHRTLSKADQPFDFNASSNDDDVDPARQSEPDLAIRALRKVMETRPSRIRVIGIAQSGR
jgi:hypothetical protein